ncbi:MAG: helix-turn-helix domain-containing protein [Thermogutta sp.]|nr:helix-turn-helix domain-containing protein [Thermogutta sp.]HOP77376.1 helix-turn-helix domain-containing protein [Thermogutta sp.]HPU06918.1 helix-turn-helix domain-containing protein [Thermogutta sp.]
MTGEREMLSLRETAKVLGLSERSVWTAIKAGRIPSTRIGKRVLIPRRLLLERLEAEARAAMQASNDEGAGR